MTEEKAYILLLTQSYLVKWDIMSWKFHCYFKISDYKCFSGSTGGKELVCQRRRLKRHEFSPLVGKIPWRRAWQSTPVLLPRESHGQGSPEGHKESDKTEAT